MARDDTLLEPLGWVMLCVLGAVLVAVWWWHESGAN